MQLAPPCRRRSETRTCLGPPGSSRLWAEFPPEVRDCFNFMEATCSFRSVTFRRTTPPNADCPITRPGNCCFVNKFLQNKSANVVTGFWINQTLDLNCADDTKYIKRLIIGPAPSPLPSRSRSSSVGESLGLSGGRAMRALVHHPSSSNPKLLPFSPGETVMVLVPEPCNGWLYGRTESSPR